MAPSLLTTTSLLVLLLPALARAGWGGWTEGRASHYGDDGGATIDQGSCMFGHLDYNVGTGWDIVALSDHDPEYTGSCGRCYEVACRNARFNDGYGQYLDRSNTCYDESKSIIVRVTDTCPCYYPSNAYSNKRWCCGDMRHMDLSAWAFAKLGKKSDGVMGIRYRQVTCPSYSTGTQQAKPAGSWGTGGNSNSGSGSSSSGGSWASASAYASSGSFAPFAANSAGGPWSSDWPNRIGRKMMDDAAAQEPASKEPRAPSPAK